MSYLLENPLEHLSTSLNQTDVITRSSVMLIGAGFHAKEVYLPALTAGVGHLVAVVDIEPNRPFVEEQLQRLKLQPETRYLAPWSGLEMPREVKAGLASLARATAADCVIVSTPPEYHLTYMLWAIENGLHCLVDKPIVCAPNASTQVNIVRDLRREFRNLLEYAMRKDILLVVAAQRRHHVGFQALRLLAIAVSERRGIPISKISSSHSDGSLRLPPEIGRIENHGVLNGTGKLWHSGYHEIDLQSVLIQDCIKASGRSPGELYDEVHVFADTLRAQGFIRQISRPSWALTFGEEVWNEICAPTDEELIQAYSKYGEIDVSSISSFRKHGSRDHTFSAELRLSHNSFSRRSTTDITGRDLYKGVGRVKHERHEIRHGPFSVIYVDTLQSSPKHDKNGASDYEFGGNNHFEIIHFMSPELLGTPDRVIRRFTASEIADAAGIPSSTLLMRHAKGEMLTEFLSAVSDPSRRRSSRSCISTHRFGMEWMLTIAEAIASDSVVQQALPL